MDELVDQPQHAPRPHHPGRPGRAPAAPRHDPPDVAGEGRTHTVGHGARRPARGAGRRRHAAARRGQRGRLRRRADRQPRRSGPHRDQRPLRPGQSRDRAGGVHQPRRDRPRGADGRVPRLHLHRAQAPTRLPRRGRHPPLRSDPADLRRGPAAGGEPHHLGHDDLRRRPGPAARRRPAGRSGLVFLRGRDVLDRGLPRHPATGRNRNERTAVGGRGGRQPLRFARRMAGAQGPPRRQRHRHHRHRHRHHRHRPGGVGDGHPLPPWRRRVRVPRRTGHPHGSPT